MFLKTFASVYCIRDAQTPVLGNSTDTWSTWVLHLYSQNMYQYPKTDTSCIHVYYTHGVYDYAVKESLITCYRFCFILIHLVSPVLSGRRWAWPPEVPTALHPGSWRFWLLPLSAQKTLVFKNNCTALLQRWPSSRLLFTLVATELSFIVLMARHKFFQIGLALGNFETGFKMLSSC